MGYTGKMRGLLVILLVACSSDATTMTPDAPVATPDADPNALRVAGNYATTVTLGESTCTGIIVQNMPTTVAHVPGDTQLVLSHAGNAYPGTVEPDGSFATPPRAVGGGGETHTITITGAFSTTGFEATLSVDVTRPAAGPCAYTVEWIGVKNGEPNHLPG